MTAYGGRATLLLLYRHEVGDAQAADLHACMLRLIARLSRRRPAPGLIADAQVAQLFWLLAAITMTAGNILALLQDNLKRILAYSSVAHGGYMLIGLAAAPHLRATGAREMHGTEATFFYLIAYGAMTIGAFAVLAYLRTPQREVETVDDLAGVGRTQPLIALAMSVFLFSLIGLPRSEERRVGKGW